MRRSSLEGVVHVGHGVASLPSTKNLRSVQPCYRRSEHPLSQVNPGRKAHPKKELPFLRGCGAISVPQPRKNGKRARVSPAQGSHRSRVTATISPASLTKTSTLNHSRQLVASVGWVLIR